MSHWKRLLIFVLMVSVLSSFLIFPASADELDQFYDVLAVATANNGNSNQVYFSSAGYTVNFDLPVSMVWYGIDSVIRIPHSGFTVELVTNTGSSVASLNKISLGNNLYRIYVNDIAVGGDIHIKFTTTANNVNFLSLNIQSSPVVSFSEIGSVSVLTGSSSVISGTMTDSSSPVKVAINPDRPTGTGGTGSGAGTQIFESISYNSSANKYDYLVFFFTVQSATVNSISAFDSNGSIVPSSVTWVDGNLPSYDDYDGSETGESGEISSSVHVNRSFFVTLDLSNYDRSDNVVNIKISGTNDDYYSGYVQLTSVSGYIESKLPNNELFFLSRIWDSLKSGFQNVVSGVSALGDRLVGQLTSFETNITNWIYSISNKITNLHNDLIDWFDKDTVANDQLDQDLADQESELGEISDSFGSVTQPTVGDDLIVLDPNIVSPNALSAITGISNKIFQNEFFLTVFSLSFLFALVSYVLFGKR